MKTEALRQALDIGRYDAAFGGARRDEEKSRAKERIFSHRSAAHAWDPRNQRPELWRLFNTRIREGESMRVFPLSNWTELDVWEYVQAERIPVVPLYFSKVRPVVERSGALIMVDDDRLPLGPGEKPRMLRVRFRTLGCYPLTGAIEFGRRDARRHHRRNARCDNLRAAGTSHRHRRIRVDGEEEARGVLLMGETSSAALPTLRLLTCGSVDDGKSTLIGRLLYEKKLIFDDQLVALERDSKKFGTTEDSIDFALLVDGLEAEREQGITIDVAYRYFATSARSFIVADTPGHEQYTRNMATGASNADLAIVLVDARKGLLTQTHRHSIIVSLLGVRHVVLAVNKIDLVGYDERIFRDIVIDYRKFAESLGFRSLHAIPISARFGDNVSSRSARTPWYQGAHLLEHLERIEVEEDRRAAPFRLPVQWINRPHLDFRGFTGTIPSGRVRRGDPIVVAGSGRQHRGRPHSGRGPGGRERRSRGRRDRFRWPTRSTSRAATYWRIPRAGPKSPTSSRPTSFG